MQFVGTGEERELRDAGGGLGNTREFLMEIRYRRSLD